MPLVSTGLARSLEQVFRSPSQRPDEVARAWAQAYADYAQGAISIVGGSPLPASIAAAKVLLATSLTAMFMTSRVAPQSAAQYAAALTAFWFAPPIAFTPIPPALPGIVTVVAGGPALQGLLLSTWAQNLASRADPGQAARSLAQALDAFTRSVVVTHLMPPPAPPILGPIV